jgi:hypothetical protein
MNREVKEILGVAGVCLAIICVVYFRSRQEPEAIHYGSGAPHLSTEKLDTVKRERYSVEAAPYIFETAFFADTRDRLYGKTVQFFGVNIGKIKIESGKIIACDGIGMNDVRAFAAVFPIGSFPVQLSIAKIGTDERVAFSRILFSDGAVQKWAPALVPGQRSLTIRDSTYYGYPVDGGTGLFADSVTNAAYSAYIRANPELWESIFIKEMEKHKRSTWDYNLFTLGQHNFAGFSTGWGDGRYGSYIGYDRDGKICQLLTDFELVDWYR